MRMIGSMRPPPYTDLWGIEPTTALCLGPCVTTLVLYRSATHPQGTGRFSTRSTRPSTGGPQDHPRLETGRVKRTLATRPGITPSQRARILEKFGHACIGCGGRPPRVELTLEHIISREIAAKYGMLDAPIDSEWNLAPMCPECNSGHRHLSRPSVELMYRAIQMSALPPTTTQP